MTPDTQPTPAQSHSSYVYEGPLSTAVRRLKVRIHFADALDLLQQHMSWFSITHTPLPCQRLSIFGCSATIVGAPVLVFLGPDASSLMAKASIALTLCSFGVFSTGMGSCC